MTERSPLDLPLETMRELGYRVTDVVAEHLASLREQPAYTVIHRREADALLETPPPDDGTPFDTLLEELQKGVFAYHAREPHPGFIAFVPSCPTFPAVMGDWLATGFNLFTGVWPLASGANELEVVVLDWFRQWIGMPAGAGGILTSGGSVATLTAVVAARHAALDRDPDALARLVLYTSEQAHSSVPRAAWVAGVPRSQVRLVPVDADRQMRMDRLADMVASDRAAGLCPFMVVGSGGTTNTGAVDPMVALSALCTRERLWLHVDAAFAGFAVLTDRGKAALAGLEMADSITLDPHKWLFVPFECGSLLVRDPRRLKAAFQINPEYLRDTEAQGDDINYADYGVQLTRSARALKVWMSIRYFGMSKIREAIDHGIDMAEVGERAARASATLEVLSPARLGVMCFRACPAGLDEGALDALNDRISQRVNGAGRYFVATTRLNGKLAIRICTLGFRTAETDIRGLISDVSAYSQELT